MFGGDEAISAERARVIVGSLPIAPSAVETIPLEDSFGRVLASDVHSPEDLPGFPRSTVDGYAVQSSDTFGCAETLPAYLTVRGKVVMGVVPGSGLSTGEAMYIPTGGMIPEGADAVVMIEHVQSAEDGIIEVLKAVGPSENIIRANEDIARNELVLKKGCRLRPQDVGALAGIGIDKVTVFKRPVVAVVSTGDEVVPVDSPMRPGQVRDVNSYNLAGLIIESGAVPVLVGIVPDDFDELQEAVSRALVDSDLVLVSGGSSVGVKDMTARIFENLEPGGVLVHGVAVKPGKPLIAGLVRGKPVFGLPGHPAAVTVCFLNFVAPVIVKMACEERTAGTWVHESVSAVLSKNVSSAPGREDHIRVSLRWDSGTLFADPILGKSGLIRTLVMADGIFVVPSQAQGIGKGERVEVRLFRR